MSAAGSPVTEGEEPVRGPVQPSGLLDVLGVASVVLDTKGRVVLWSPQAEELFGYTAQEALGEYAARLMVHEQHADLVVKLFADVMLTGEGWASTPSPYAARTAPRGWSSSAICGSWTTAVPCTPSVSPPIRRPCAGLSGTWRCPRGSSRSRRSAWPSWTPICGTCRSTRRWSASTASPPRSTSAGRSPRSCRPSTASALEAAARQVLATGVPLVEQHTVGRTPADPDEDHAWSISFYRLEDALGTVLGVATSVVDVTERHRANIEAEAARRRLAVIADATTRIGTTLELDRTAHELADVAVPELADVAAVDLLEAVMEGRPSVLRPAQPHGDPRAGRPGGPCQRSARGGRPRRAGRPL